MNRFTDVTYVTKWTWYSVSTKKTQDGTSFGPSAITTQLALQETVHGIIFQNKCWN